MIWFRCSKCQKTQGRPESAAGAMVFCECGQGNVVPWESNAPEPALPIAAVEVATVPSLEPVTFEPDLAKETRTPAAEDRPRSRRERRDPNHCFNHQRVPKAGACADCDEGFCANCLVQFQDKALCGPCKNFRTRRLELPPLNAALSSASIIVAVLASPLALCTLSSSPSSGMRVLGLVSLLPQAVALALGLWALRIAEKERKIAGEALAITGIAAAAVMMVLTVLLNVYGGRVLT